MDLQKYKALIHVIEQGSLAKAADKCHITTSGLCRMMNSIEDELKFKIFYREKDGVKPTKECLLLLPHIKELLRLEKNVKEIAASISGSLVGNISIGIAYSSYYKMLSDLCTKFKQSHKDVTFNFKSGYSSELISNLNDGSIDIALTSKRECSFDFTNLGFEDLVAWVPKNHELCKKGFVNLKDFEKYPYIDIFPGRDIDNSRIFKENKISPNILMGAEDSFAVYQIVGAGLGITLNHRSNCNNWIGNVDILPIKPSLKVEVGFYIPKSESPVIKTFSKFLKENI